MGGIGNTVVFDNNLKDLKREVCHLVEAGASEEDIDSSINRWADTLDIEERETPYNDPY